jgi:hypothetical protein
VPVYDAEQVARWEQIINKCPLIEKNAKFFILKSIDEENLRVSQLNNVWATTFGPTRKLS